MPALVKRLSDAGQSENLDVKRLIRGLNSFQVLAGVASEPEIKLVAGHGLLDRIVMSIKLVANGRSDKIGTIRVEPFLHEEID